MDITSLQPDEDTQRILGHILAELEPDDPERPWKKGELQCPVQEDDFPVPELARAALVWAGFASQSGWDGAPRQDGSSSRSNADVAATIATGVRDELALCPEYCSGLRAVLVKVDGRTVFEKYYNASPDDTFNTCSVTKSVLSTLVGIAVGEGKLDLHETLSQLLPKYASSMAPPTSGATLRQLLSRTAGFNDRSEFEFSADWVEDIVTSADVTPPGDRFVYSNESAHLVSAILAEATGESVLQYARARLFDPLEISTEPAFTPAFTPPCDAGHVADSLGPVSRGRWILKVTRPVIAG